MRTYDFTEYRPAVSHLLESWKEGGRGRTLSSAAKVIGVQVSYLSNALKERVHLNSDQLDSLGRFLNLPEKEIDYLLLLLEAERSGVPERKRRLIERLKQIRKRELSTELQLQVEAPEFSSAELEKYYLDPFVQLVHIYLGLRNGSTLSQLREDLGLASEHGLRILNLLTGLKVVSSKDQKYYSIKEGHHLPKDSPVATPHLILMRVKSMDQLTRLKPDDRYCFSVTLSAAPADREKLEQEFIKFLKRARSIVKDSPAERLYQMNFDLFPWQLGETPKR